MNRTILKFGYPETLLSEYDNWVVLVRQKQITAGCLVLACKSEETALADLPAEAFGELKAVTLDIQRVLQPLVEYQQINYVALMMVDPHVHFHVIPRHESPREIAGVEFIDHSWPGPPDFASTLPLSEMEFSSLVLQLRTSWTLV